MGRGATQGNLGNLGEQKARRKIKFSSQLGRFEFTFPEGHVFAETEETILATYGKDTLTISKKDVWGLRVEATYRREGYERSEVKPEVKPEGKKEAREGSASEAGKARDSFVSVPADDVMWFY